MSAVGDDDFGTVSVERLERDGVDISAVHIDRDRPTGSAFVRYRSDGSRDFVFNIKHSASGHLHITSKAKTLLKTSDHLHIMGSSLSSAEFVNLNVDTAEAVTARGGTVSFDPNLRKEILSAPGMAAAMTRIVGLTDLFLPSGEELTLLTEAKNAEAAIEELLNQGVQAIVHKNGSDGACFHDAEHRIQVDAYPVEEVDPTGAGDCFGATFTSYWLRGMPPEKALTYAAAAGALAVTKRGPMEGVSSQDEIETFLNGTRTKEASA